MNKKYKPKTIAVDFDKTIALYAPEDWANEYLVKTCPSTYRAKPNKELCQFLKARMAMGDRVIVYTSRWWGDYAVVSKWLKRHRVPFTDIVCGKFKADLFIDDKNVNSYEDDDTWELAANHILDTEK